MKDIIIDLNDQQIQNIIKDFSLLENTISHQSKNETIYNNYYKEYYLRITTRSSGFRKIQVSENLYNLIN